ncbi:hypothetical protein [Sandaracinus amylolyticus]|uniref:hypothetical protein n=1 Tax=Sandaracinus amylolyticus TaxID=927083 RepID=UPI001F490502|nr:hypothetical protein [Sandaracinus amylolyticus]UJR85533.1 Hypothetical protein I5071_76130 [Sandaracinus amylolyticus]
MNILLLGLRAATVDAARAQIEQPGLTVSVGTNIEDLRAVFARTTIDHVFIGGALPLETRLELVGEIFRLSDATTVHMKDLASGREGFLPFVRGVLRGLTR